MPQMRLLTTRCQTSCWRSRALGSSMSSISTNSSRRRAEARRSVQTKELRAEWLDIIRVRMCAGVENSRPVHDRHSHTGQPPLPYLSTPSGSCLTSQPVKRWRTCWPRSTTRSGATTIVLPVVASAGIGLDALRPCVPPSGADSRPRRSRFVR